MRERGTTVESVCTDFGDGRRYDYIVEGGTSFKRRSTDDLYVRQFDRCQGGTPLKRLRTDHRYVLGYDNRGDGGVVLESRGTNSSCSVSRRAEPQGRTIRLVLEISTAVLPRKGCAYCLDKQGSKHERFKVFYL